MLLLSPGPVPSRLPCFIMNCTNSSELLRAFSALPLCSPSSGLQQLLLPHSVSLPHLKLASFQGCPFLPLLFDSLCRLMSALPLSPSVNVRRSCSQGICSSEQEAEAVFWAVFLLRSLSLFCAFSGTTLPCGCPSFPTLTAWTACMLYLLQSRPICIRIIPRTGWARSRRVRLPHGTRDTLYVLCRCLAPLW